MRVGLVMIAPNVIHTVASVAAGFAADSCIRDGMRIATTRRIIHAVSQLIPACAVLLLGYVSDPIGIVSLVAIAGKVLILENRSMTVA